VPEDVALVEVPVPELAAGEVLVRNAYLSVDPYMRGRMDDVLSYAAPYEVGQAMDGGAVGEVVASRDPSLPVGTSVQHELGWRTHAVVPAADAVVVDPHEAPLPQYLGVLGMPGMTAWVGLFDVAQVRQGETVWVSAAAGAVGSLAGQLARLAGCRVVGSAGGADRCRYVVEELGFDACVDHAAGDLEGRLREVLPSGLDVYFDNVGGSHLRAALALANPYGRFVECGMISSYGGSPEPVDNLSLVVGKRPDAARLPRPGRRRPRPAVPAARRGAAARRQRPLRRDGRGGHRAPVRRPAGPAARRRAPRQARRRRPRRLAGPAGGQAVSAAYPGLTTSSMSRSRWSNGMKALFIALMVSQRRSLQP
jgi:NADPH-dependent curcumin reductase CurA